MKERTVSWRDLQAISESELAASIGRTSELILSRIPFSSLNMLIATKLFLHYILWPLAVDIQYEYASVTMNMSKLLNGIRESMSPLVLPMEAASSDSFIACQVTSRDRNRIKAISNRLFIKIYFCILQLQSQFSWRPIKKRNFQWERSIDSF